MEIAVVSITGEADLEADRDPALLPDLDLGDRERDLLSGDAVLLDTFVFFLSCLNRLSTFLFFKFGLFSFRIREISFCNSRAFFCKSETLSS